MDLNQVTLLAAGAVVVVHQILKLRIIPVAFANKYPVPTNILLSIIAAVVVKWNSLVLLHGFNDWVTYIATIAVIAAITFNQLLGRWEELRSLEGTGKK